MNRSFKTSTIFIVLIISTLIGLIFSLKQNQNNVFIKNISTKPYILSLNHLANLKIQTSNIFSPTLKEVENEETALDTNQPSDTPNTNREEKTSPEEIDLDSVFRRGNYEDYKDAYF